MRSNTPAARKNVAKRFCDPRADSNCWLIFSYRSRGCHLLLCIGTVVVRFGVHIGMCGGELAGLFRTPIGGCGHEMVPREADDDETKSN